MKKTKTLLTYVILSIAIESVFVIGLFDLAIAKWIYKFPLNTWIVLELLCLILIPINLVLNARSSDKEDKQKYNIQFSSSDSALASWRMNQILFRNRASRACLLATMLIVVFAAYLSFTKINFSALILLSMVASLGLSWALSFQLQEDMNHSWIEKTIGVSQEEIEKSYLKSSIVLSIVPSIALFSSCFLARHSLNAGLQLALICLSGPLCFSGIMFQIDPRRPVIQILCSLLIILFIGTAIFAHPLSALFVPVIIYYGRQQQADQFYTY